MNPILARRLRFYAMLFGALAVIGWIITPPPHGARRNARRAACLSNLKQISLAFMQYSQDYDEKLPSANWGRVLRPYVTSELLFSCPETTNTEDTNDYFFNSRFVGAPTEKISSPTTLILMGDGKADAPFDATLAQLPATWLQDENSPAWRHLDTANYAFADGHVKALKVNRISRDFRMVQP